MGGKTWIRRETEARRDDLMTRMRLGILISLIGNTDSVEAGSGIEPLYEDLQSSA